MSNAVNQAIQIDLGEPPHITEGKRKLFNDLAYAEYQAKLIRSGLEPESDMSQDEFCRLVPETGKYFYTELNAAWWGFQAGFRAATLGVSS